MKRAVSGFRVTGLLKGIGLFLGMIGLGACTRTEHAPCFVRTVACFPLADTAFAKGTSALYAGFSGGRLLLAGGCNFPDVPAAQGGAKRYYDQVYAGVMQGDRMCWKLVGHLPVPSAYGVAVPDSGRLLVAGGMNAQETLRSVLSLRLDQNDVLQVDTVFGLPCTLDNMGGDMYDRCFYLAGGNCDGQPSNRVFRLDLRKQTGWKELPPFPGEPRVQPVVAATGDALYVFGGFYAAPSAGLFRVMTDGFRYDFASGSWTRVDGPVAGGDSCTLAGASVLRLSDTLFLAVGGVNREVFLDAVSGRYALVRQEDYLAQPVAWYRFNRRAFLYDVCRNRWSECGYDSLLGRAGAALLRGEAGEVWLAGGEVKPGVRTPSISRIDFSDRFISR